MEISVAINNVIRTIETQGGQKMASLLSASGAGAVGGMGLIAMLRNRIEKTGIDSKGQKFKGYSTKTTLWGASRTQKGSVSIANVVYKELAGSKSKRSQLKWVTKNGHRLFVLEGGYKKAKSIFKGGTADYVDFNVTGTFWRSVKVVKFGNQNNRIYATYTATDDRKKVEGLEAKRPGILLPNKQELKIVEISIKEWIVDLLVKEIKK